jgi:hypothetical protein
VEREFLKGETMVSQTYTVTGTMTNQNTVSLDESLPITAAKVRVTIETLNEQPTRPLNEVLAEIHQRLQASGHRPPTPQEVDEYLRQERDSWEQ